MLAFCLDIGGSNTRGVLYSPEGAVLGRANGPGGALSLGVERAAQAIRSVWDDIQQGLGASRVKCSDVKLVAGIAGWSLPGRVQSLADFFEHFGETVFVSDGYGALIAAKKGQPCALISIGTGVTGQRYYASGRALALSGWGFPAGDVGGGAWMGLKAVEAYLKYCDGIFANLPLTPAFVGAISKLVGRQGSEIVAWQSSAAPADFGQLAPLVVKHASEGDCFCLSILTLAAQEILALAHALHDNETVSNAPREIMLSGGLAQVLLPHCQAADLAQESGNGSRPAFGWKFAAIDPTSGLFLIASGKVPVENSLKRPQIL
jgi:glucosamine kinase